MQVSTPLKVMLSGAVSLALAGCLVSEEPVLDAKSGNAAPLEAGAYEMCPVREDADEGECEQFSISIDETGLYEFQTEDDEDGGTHLRFRRIARGGYAVQAEEDDGYMYYYGRDAGASFELVMMMCDALSEKTRARLIERGDLASDDDDFVSCEVKTVRGLKAAALDYHYGRAADAEDGVMAFTPIANP